MSDPTSNPVENLARMLREQSPLLGHYWDYRKNNPLPPGWSEKESTWDGNINAEFRKGTLAVLVTFGGETAEFIEVFVTELSGGTGSPVQCDVAGFLQELLGLDADTALVFEGGPVYLEHDPDVDEIEPIVPGFGPLHRHLATHVGRRYVVPYGRPLRRAIPAFDRAN